MRWLFNVIKGNLINKNIKSVVISTDRNKVEENNKNIKKEFETLDEIQEKSEELFFEHEEKMEYETEETESCSSFANVLIVSLSILYLRCS